jgi:hypothetical protein
MPDANQGTQAHIQQVRVDKCAPRRVPEDACLGALLGRKHQADETRAGGRWRMTMGDILVDAGAANRRRGSIERRLEVLNLKFDVIIGGLLLVLGMQAMTLMRLDEINCQIAEINCQIGMMVHGGR